VKIFDILGFEFQVKDLNSGEYLFLTCIAVAFLDQWTSKFSKWCTRTCSWAGTRRNALPELCPR